jgi:hydroxymethylpyrimidine/phosphomethylpyrimidine kinase
VRLQLEAVFAELPPRACKTGMLFNAALIGATAEFFRRQPRPPLVVDPVMAATSGASLLQAPAFKALTERLLPLAALVTPNLPEAERLLDCRIQSEEDMRQAARRVRERFGCAALIKGGHLPGARQGADIFYDGRNELLLTARFIRGLSLHGTGCTYSAAITGYLALGRALPEAVALGKEYITQAIAHSRLVEGHRVLNWLAAVV